MRTTIRLARTALLAAALAAPVFFVSTDSARAEAKRHHIGLGLGAQRFVSDDFDDSGFETAGVGTLAYRYSVSPSVDLVWDMRATASQQDALYDLLGTPAQAEATYTTSWVGVGARFTGSGEGARPYVQANLYFVQEMLNVDFGSIEAEDSEDGIGFGAQAGVDIRLSRLLSLPIETNLLVGNPENSLTSVGASVGLTFNFGALR
jgi:hypothetical protein